MNYEKPKLIKLTKEELKRAIVASANSACGNLGCDDVFAGDAPDCSDRYHEACLDEDNWTSGECITGGSWRDR